MRFPNKPRIQPRIHLTALIDIVFLLLVFFLLASNFSKYQTITVSVPEVSSKNEELIRDITVIIDQHGKVSFEEVELDYSGLLTVLKIQLKLRINNNVVIHADHRVQYDFVAQVIDIAKVAGAKNIMLVTKRKPDY